MDWTSHSLVASAASSCTASWRFFCRMCNNCLRALIQLRTLLWAALRTGARRECPRSLHTSRWAAQQLTFWGTLGRAYPTCASPSRRCCCSTCRGDVCLQRTRSSLTSRRQSPTRTECSAQTTSPCGTGSVSPRFAGMCVPSCWLASRSSMQALQLPACLRRGTASRRPQRHGPEGGAVTWNASSTPTSCGAPETGPARRQWTRWQPSLRWLRLRPHPRRGNSPRRWGMDLARKRGACPWRKRRPPPPQRRPSPLPFRINWDH
mmetsp:Transcript_30441/g.58560  ORF Transcript_30441/g.58560 Transcript_30441/m.58560 type:complete len:263 (+) Transcript_30441:1049-1837(+)